MYDPLHRNIAHQPNEAFPDSLRIVARWGEVEKTIDIDAALYFGRYGSSPLSGEALMSMINNLRRQAPK